MTHRLAPLAAVVLLAGCGSHAAARPSIGISTRTAFVDAPPRIVVRGVAGGRRTPVRAETVDLVGQGYRGRIVVRADAAGVVHVPMPALLASLQPRGGGDYLDIVPWSGQFVTVTAAGRSVRFRLLVRGENVVERRLSVAADGFTGSFFRAPARVRRPAVLLFGGSEGGLSVAEEGAMLASRGFPTLALAYFALPGLPQKLSRIPIDYFAAALRWLGRQPGVDPRRLIVDGSSRGSEAALLTAAYYPQLVHAVVATVPGNVVLCDSPSCEGPAWTLRGGVPSYQNSYGPDGPDFIPVERFHGRVLLVCAGGDLLWPSCPMARAIVARRQGAPTELLAYPHAGHGIGNLLPNIPQRFAQLEGVAPLDNTRARADAWPKLLRFLAG